MVNQAGPRFWPAEGLEQGVTNKQHFLWINSDDLKCLKLHTAGQLDLLCRRTRFCPSCPNPLYCPWACSGKHKSRHLSIPSEKSPQWLLHVAVQSVQAVVSPLAAARLELQLLWLTAALMVNINQKYTDYLHWETKQPYGNRTPNCQHFLPASLLP